MYYNLKWIKKIKQDYKSEKQTEKYNSTASLVLMMHNKLGQTILIDEGIDENRGRITASEMNIAVDEKYLQMTSRSSKFKKLLLPSKRCMLAFYFWVRNSFFFAFFSEKVNVGIKMWQDCFMYMMIFISVSFDNHIVIHYYILLQAETQKRYTKP